MLDLTDFLGDIPDWKKYFTVDVIHDNARKSAEEYPEI
jgi:hypothetical protein